jgi:hypothetical protein
MPQYEMTAAEQTEYGNNLNIWQAIRLLQTWHPLITFGQRFVNTPDPYAKSLVVSEAAEWLASKTDSTADDQVVRHIANVLKTKEGEALVRLLLTFAGVQ